MASGSANQPREGARQPTISDVAERAQVSTATVSRVLNDLTVSAPTRAKVIKAIRDLGYVMNTHARALAGSRARTVAVVVHSADAPAFNAIISGVQQQATAEGRLCLVCVIDGDPETEIDAVTEMGAHSADAVVLVGRVADTPDHADRIQRLSKTLDAGGSRLVLCGRKAPADDLPATIVDYDNEGGAFAAASHLLSLGHERILYLGGNTDSPTIGERVAGLRRAVQAYGRQHDPELLAPGPVNQLFGYRRMRELLADGLDATAVLAANDATAAGVMRAIRDSGLSIPDDLSVVGYDDVWLAAELYPALTTVHVPWEEIGRTAIRNALHRDREDTSAHRTMLGTHLVVRQSVTPRRPG